MTVGSVENPESGIAAVLVVVDAAKRHGVRWSDLRKATKLNREWRGGEMVEHDPVEKKKGVCHDTL